MSAKLKAFEDAVDKLFSAPSNDVRRQADVWLRQLLGSQEAWGVGLEVLAPTSTSSSDAKNAAASMVANKLKQNSPPITSVQAATLLEKFIPLCRTVGGGKVAHQVAEQLCSSVVRAAILAGGAPGQPVARTMHAAVERLCVRSDLYATLDPLAVLLILECAATELVRLTPPRSPAPVESMGLGGMVGIVRALKYSFGMGGDGLPWPPATSLSVQQAAGLRLAGLRCLRAWAVAGLELLTVYAMEPLAVRGLLSLLGQPASSVSHEVIQCVAATVTASLEHGVGQSQMQGPRRHRYQGPPPAPQIDATTLRQHAELIPLVVGGVRTAFEHGRHHDASTATALVQLCVALANRTDVVLPLLGGAGGATVSAGAKAVQQLLQLLLQWLQSAAKATAVVGMPEPLAVAEVILDAVLWEDVQKLPTGVSLVGTSPATGPMAPVLWQKLLQCTLDLASFPAGFSGWEVTPLRRGVAQSGSESVYGDEDEFQRFRRSFAREVFTTGCEVLGSRAVDALVRSFGAALGLHASSPRQTSPASAPSAHSANQWHKAEVALFALGAMANVVATQTSQASKRAMSPRGVDQDSQWGGAGAVSRGRGRGRGVPLGGGSPRRGFGADTGGDAAGGWSDAEVAATNKGLEQVFMVLFRGSDALPSLAGAAAAASPSASPTIRSTGRADRSLMARLLHVAAASCVGNFGRWLRRHNPATPTHAARYLISCLRDGYCVSSASGGSGGVGGSSNEVGDAAAIALAKLTFACCGASGGSAGVQLCSVETVQSLMYRVLGLATDVAATQASLPTLLGAARYPPGLKEESYQRLLEACGRLILNEPGRKRVPHSGDASSTEHETRSCLVMLLAEPCSSGIQGHFREAETQGNIYWTSARVNAVVQQLQLLGVFLRLVPNSPGAAHVIHSVWVPAARTVAAATAPAVLLGVCAGFVNDLTRSEHHREVFATKYLQSAVRAVQAGVSRRPVPQLLNLCKFLVQAYGSGKEAAFVALLDGLTNVVVPPLVAALRRGEKTFKMQSDAPPSSAVDCHGLLVGILELLNHLQGACGDGVYTSRGFDTCLSLAVTALGSFARDAKLGMLVCSLLNQAAYKLRSSTNADTRAALGRAFFARAPELIRASVFAIADVLPITLVPHMGRLMSHLFPVYRSPPPGAGVPPNALQGWISAVLGSAGAASFPCKAVTQVRPLSGKLAPTHGGLLRFCAKQR
eukprot:INCI4066.3.p1 GENE.INCI4066.3~~INCI4066.3.p1  ORF type:complete len:1208 (-),score=171.45 INCI4066.3:410-4033(-)